MDGCTDNALTMLEGIIIKYLVGWFIFVLQQLNNCLLTSISNWYPEKTLNWSKTLRCLLHSGWR